MDDVDLTQLPDEFHDLIPLIEQWAIGDDVEREEKMQAASTQQLQQLAATLQPRFGAIDAYLDEHDHLYEATFLGKLAEAAVEAGFELEARGTP